MDRRDEVRGRGALEHEAGGARVPDQGGDGRVIVHAEALPFGSSSTGRRTGSRLLLQRGVLAACQELLRGDGREETQEPGDRPGPARLVAGAQTRAVVTVEILVEQDGVAPVRVIPELLGSAVHRPPPTPRRCRKVFASRPANSSATWYRFITRPEPVGHSTVNIITVVGVVLHQGRR